MHGGVLISMFVSAHARPTCMSTKLQCKSGAVEINGFHGYAVVTPGEVSKAAKIGAPFLGSLRTLTAASSNLASRSLRREPAYSGLRELVRRFYVAVASGGESKPPIDRATIIEGATLRDILAAANDNHGHPGAS